MGHTSLFLFKMLSAQEDGAKQKTPNSLQTTTPVSARRLFFIHGKKGSQKTKHYWFENWWFNVRLKILVCIKYRFWYQNEKQSDTESSVRVGLTNCGAALAWTWSPRTMACFFLLGILNWQCHFHIKQSYFNIYRRKLAQSLGKYDCSVPLRPLHVFSYILDLISANVMKKRCQNSALLYHCLWKVIYSWDLYISYS